MTITLENRERITNAALWFTWLVLIPATGLVSIYGTGWLMFWLLGYSASWPYYFVFGLLLQMLPLAGFVLWCAWKRDAND